MIGKTTTQLMAAAAVLVTSMAWASSQDAVELKDALQKTEVGKMATSVPLQLVGDGAFEESVLTSVPEYYILYFSASW